MVKLPPLPLATLSASTSMPLVKARCLPHMENFHSTFCAAAVPQNAASAPDSATAMHVRVHVMIPPPVFGSGSLRGMDDPLGEDGSTAPDGDAKIGVRARFSSG